MAAILFDPADAVAQSTTVLRFSGVTAGRPAFRHPVVDIPVRHRDGYRRFYGQYLRDDDFRHVYPFGPVGRGQEPADTATMAGAGIGRRCCHLRRLNADALYFYC